MTDEPGNRLKHDKPQVSDDYGTRPAAPDPVEPWRFQKHARGLSWPFAGALVAGFLLAMLVGWLLG